MEGGRSQKAEQLNVGFTFGNFGLCGAQVGKVREGIKNDGRQKQKCNFVPSALFPSVNKSFQQNYHNNQFVVMPNKMFSLYCCDYPMNYLPTFLSGLSLVLVYLVLGSYQYQADPSKYNPLYVNLIQTAYGTRIICLLGSSWCQDLPPSPVTCSARKSTCPRRLAGLFFKPCHALDVQAKLDWPINDRMYRKNNS